MEQHAGEQQRGFKQTFFYSSSGNLVLPGLPALRFSRDGCPCSAFVPRTPSPRTWTQVSFPLPGFASPPSPSGVSSCRSSGDLIPLFLPRCTAGPARFLGPAPRPRPDSGRSFGRGGRDLIVERRLDRTAPLLKPGFVGRFPVFQCTREC